MVNCWSWSRRCRVSKIVFSPTKGTELCNLVSPIFLQLETLRQRWTAWTLDLLLFPAALEGSSPETRWYKTPGSGKQKTVPVVNFYFGMTVYICHNKTRTVTISYFVSNVEQQGICLPAVGAKPQQSSLFLRPLHQRHAVACSLVIRRNLRPGNPKAHQKKKWRKVQWSIQSITITWMLWK